jgi:hypothetical protein
MLGHALLITSDVGEGGPHMDTEHIDHSLLAAHRSLIV